MSPGLGDLRGRRKRASQTADESDAPVRDGAGYRMARRPAAWMAALAGRFGADRDACEALLLARLRIDMRVGGLRNPNKAKGTGMLLTCGFYLLNGALISALLFVPVLTAGQGMAIVTGGMLLLLGVLLVGDYLAMLIDSAEADVVAPRPVSGRTVLLARVGHLVLYLAFPMSCYLLPPWIVGTVGRWGVSWALLLPACALLAGVLGVGLLLMGFVWLLQRLDGERLQAALIRGQIASSLFFFTSYYLFIGLGANETARAWLVSDSWWHVALPPYWFGGLHELVKGATDGRTLTLAAAGLVLPLATFGLLMARTGPRLVTGLASLRAAGGDLPPPRRGPLRRLAAKLVEPGVEQAGFDMFLAIAARERGFRSRVYPLLVVPFVMLVWFALGDDGSGSGGDMQVKMWGTFIPLLYSLIVLTQLRFSDTPGASWIFAVAPLEQAGLFVSGVVKGLAFAMLLPWVVLVLLASAVMSQTMPLRDVAFAITFALVVMLAGARWMTRGVFPFSRTFSQRDSSQTSLIMLGMIGVVLLGVGQYYLGKVPWGIEGVTLAFVPLVVVLLRGLRRLRISVDDIRPVR